MGGVDLTGGDSDVDGELADVVVLEQPGAPAPSHVDVGSENAVTELAVSVITESAAPVLPAVTAVPSRRVFVGVNVADAIEITPPVIATPPIPAVIVAAFEPVVTGVRVRTPTPRTV